MVDREAGGHSFIPELSNLTFSFINQDEDYGSPKNNQEYKHLFPLLRFFSGIILPFKES